MKTGNTDHPPRHPVLGAWEVDAVACRLRATLAVLESRGKTGIATDDPKDGNAAYATAKRSSCMTLVQAAAKSSANFWPASEAA